MRAVEYRLAIYRNKVHIHAAALTNLENMILSERSPQRPHIVCFYLYEMHRTGTSIEITHQQLSRLAELRKKKMEVKGNGYGISFYGDENVLNLIG